jgi:hypothetical protein
MMAWYEVVGVVVGWLGVASILAWLFSGLRSAVHSDRSECRPPQRVKVSNLADYRARKVGYPTRKVGV